MQRARRYALVAVLALLGGVALTGCRSEPQVAAYIGKTEISEARIDRVLTELKRQIDGAEQGRTQAPGQQPSLRLPPRQVVVRTMVAGELARRVGTEKRLTPAQVDPARIAAQLGPVAGTEYVRMELELQSWMDALEAAAPPVKPTEADLRELYDNAVAAGERWAQQPFEEVSQQLNDEQVQRSLGVGKLLNEAAARNSVVINPRYRPLNYAVLSFQSGAEAIVVPLSDESGDPTVVDRP